MRHSQPAPPIPHPSRHSPAPRHWSHHTVSGDGHCRWSPPQVTTSHLVRSPGLVAAERRSRDDSRDAHECQRVRPVTVGTDQYRSAQSRRTDYGRSRPVSGHCSPQHSRPTPSHHSHPNTPHPTSPRRAHHRAVTSYCPSLRRQRADGHQRAPTSPDRRGGQGTTRTSSRRGR